MNNKSYWGYRSEGEEFLTEAETTQRQLLSDFGTPQHGGQLTNALEHCRLQAAKQGGVCPFQVPQCKGFFQCKGILAVKSQEIPQNHTTQQTSHKGYYQGEEQNDDCL